MRRREIFIDAEEQLRRAVSAADDALPSIKAARRCRPPTGGDISE
jgi:hypothetical protein